MDGRRDRSGMVDGAGDCGPIEEGGARMEAFLVVAEAGVGAVLEVKDCEWACVCLSLFLHSCWL